MEMIWLWSVIAILGLFFSACTSTQVSRADILNYLQSVGNCWTQHPSSDPLFCVTLGGHGMPINDPRVQLVGIVCDDHATTNRPQNPVEAACMLFEQVSAYYLEQFLPQLKDQTMLIPSSISINYKNSVAVAYDHVKSMFPAVCTKRQSPLVMEACQCLNLITIDHLIDVERHQSDRMAKERVYLAAEHCYKGNHGGVNYDEIKEMIPNVCDGKFDGKLDGPVVMQVQYACSFYTRHAGVILDGGRAGNVIKNYVQAKPFIPHLCKNPTTQYARLMCDKVLKDHMEILLGEAGPSGK